MNDQRLSRMEDKLDKLSEAVVSMARMEERIITVFNRMDSMDEYFKKMDERMDRIEITNAERGKTIAFAERLFWIFVTAFAGLIFMWVG